MALTSALERAPIPAVLQQHADDTASLRNTRTVLLRAPHVKLHLLRRLDDRLAAHLDGLAVASSAGLHACSAALKMLSPGTVFAAATLALEMRDDQTLNNLLAMAEPAPSVCAGLTSAFGWVSAPSLRGITKPLLDSPNPFHRDIGLAACAMHQVDPGPVLEAALADPINVTQAVIVAGKLGRRPLLTSCLSGITHPDPRHQFESARASLLLGDRGASIDKLKTFAAEAGPYQARALQLVLKLLPSDQANALLKPLSQDPAAIRTLIRGTGAAGDPVYVPWLIKQMSEPKLSRLAGESLSLITGLDLALLDLDRKPPENMEFGPNDDPEDANVAMDEDDGLPWPDPEKLATWWQANGQRFTPSMRYFVGAPPSPAQGLQVLKTGFQRQRIAAADYLCLLQPGTPLFNCAAPAWRQERLLAQMGP